MFLMLEISKAKECETNKNQSNIQMVRKYGLPSVINFFHYSNERINMFASKWISPRLSAMYLN